MFIFLKGCGIIKKNHNEKRFSVVNNGKLKAVHDDDLESLLTSLECYEKVKSGEYKCIVCDEAITLDNLGAIVPLGGSIQFTCNDNNCTKKLFELGGAGDDVG